MKVHIPTKILAETLGHVDRVIPARSVNPGLNLVRIDLEEGLLTFSGSNMDIDVRSVVGADVEGTGSVALPASVFSQVVRALPADMVDLAFGDNELEVRSGNFSTRLQLVAPESALNLSFSEALAGEVDGSALANALEHVRYAAAVADYQAVYRGVKLELHDDHLRAVASDGFRLASYHLPQSTGLDADFIIPARSVDELVRTLQSGPAWLGLDDAQLTVRSGGTTLNLKRMEGSFPDYNRVIPKSFPVSVTLPAQDLAEAVARVAVMADKSANHRVDLFIKDGTMQITAEGSFGQARESMAVMQEGSEDEIALAYNAKYLTDAVSRVSGELQIRLSGATTPSVLHDLADPAYLALIVPLRTN